MFRWAQGFELVGKSVRTTNERNRSLVDQGELWRQCLEDGSLAGTGEAVGAYTDYVGDWTMPFTFTLGVRRCPETEKVPGGLCLAVPAGEYALFESEAPSPQEAASKVWLDIWGWQASATKRRLYRCDYELWDLAAMASGRARVKVFVSVERIVRTARKLIV
jgi:predicted transcriptional regulator YdeE